MNTNPRPATHLRPWLRLRFRRSLLSVLALLALSSCAEEPAGPRAVLTALSAADGATIWSSAVTSNMRVGVFGGGQQASAFVTEEREACGAQRHAVRIYQAQSGSTTAELTDALLDADHEFGLLRLEDSAGDSGEGATVQLVRLPSGQPVWTTRLEELVQVGAGAAIAGRMSVDTVTITATRPAGTVGVVGLDRLTGEEKFQTEFMGFSAQILREVAPTTSFLVIRVDSFREQEGGTGRRALVQINREDGSVVRAIDVEDGALFTPAHPQLVVGSRVVFGAFPVGDSAAGGSAAGGSAAALRAWSLLDGTLAWVFAAPSRPLVAAPDGSALYVVGQQTPTRLVQLDPRTGVPNWARNTSEPGSARALAASPLGVFAVSSTGRVVHHSATGGELLWQIELAEGSGEGDEADEPAASYELTCVGDSVIVKVAYPLQCGN